MHYIIEAKNLFYLGENLDDAESFHVLVKNKKEKQFSANDIMTLNKIMGDKGILQFMEISGKEELMFALGVLAATDPNDQYTLLGIDAAIPSGMKERFHIRKLRTARKPRTTRKPKVENIKSKPDSSITPEPSKEKPLPDERDKEDIPTMNVPVNPEPPKVDPLPDDRNLNFIPDDFMPNAEQEDMGMIPDMNILQPNDPDKKETKGPDDMETATMTKAERQLYNMIHLTADEAHFSWDTAMLMSRILSSAIDARTEEDLAAALKAYHNGQDPIVYEKCKGHLKDILSLAKNWEQTLLDPKKTLENEEV